MQEEIDRMKKEMNKLKYTLEMVPQYNIDEFKDNDGDIAFNLASKTMTQWFCVLKKRKPTSAKEIINVLTLILKQNLV